jgi:hypothetical protein
VFQLSDVEANESAFVVWCCGFCEVMLARVPGGAAGSLRPVAMGEVSPGDPQLLKETCEAAIRGRRTRFDSGMSESMFSIHAAPSC